MSTSEQSFTEYVVNPMTGRMIKRSGRVYKKWRRAHPDQPDLEVISVPTTTRVRVPQFGTAPVVAAAQDSKTTPQEHAATHELHDWSSVPQQVVASATVPPTRHMLPTSRLPGNLSITEHLPQPMDHVDVHQHERHVDRWVQEWLREHGSDLLMNFNDPHVDFLQASLDKLGVHEL